MNTASERTVMELSLNEEGCFILHLVNYPQTSQCVLWGDRNTLSIVCMPDLLNDLGVDQELIDTVDAQFPVVLPFYGDFFNAQLRNHFQRFDARVENLLLALLESRNTAVQAWIKSIPEHYMCAALKFSGCSLRLLMIAARFIEARQLLVSAPILLWLILVYYEPGENRSIADWQSCLRLKQPLMLKPLVLSGEKAAIKWLNKLDWPYYDAEAMHLLKQWLLHPRHAELVHYQVITSTLLIILLACPELIGSRWSFNEHEVAGVSHVQLFIEQIKDSQRMAEQLGVSLRYQQQLKVLTQNHAFKRLHDELMLEMQRQQYFAKPIHYPEPPVAGIRSIVPITNSTQLFQEGDSQNNCVSSYHDAIVNGDYYIYQVLHPERATVGLYIATDLIKIDQIYCANNEGVSAETKAKVKAWLDMALHPEIAQDMFSNESNTRYLADIFSAYQRYSNQ